MANAKQDHIGSAQRVYALALLELAADTQKLDLVVDQVYDLLKLIRQDADLASILDSLMLTVEQRRSILDNVFKGQIDDMILHFMQVVNAKNRLSLLPSIFEAFVKLVDEKRGVIEVEAHVAAALDDATAARVADGIGQALGGKVVLHQKVVPSLIGGIKIRVGDRVIDGSVAAQLRQVRRQLIETGREQARTGTAIESV